MADHEELRGTTLGGVIGCLTAFVFGMPTFMVAMIWAFFGDCLDSEECHRGEGWRFLVVILLTMAVAIPVGVLVRQLVNWMVRRKA